MTMPEGVTAAGPRILEVLHEVTGDGEVLTDLDIELFESGLLDSLGIVSLLVAFEQAFGLTLSPSDLDREAWATPRRLVVDIERRLAAVGPAR